MDAGYEQRHRLWELAGIRNYDDSRLVIGGKASDPDDYIVTKNHNNYFVGSINGVYGAIPHEELFVLAKQTYFNYADLTEEQKIFAGVLGEDELQHLAKTELRNAYRRVMQGILPNQPTSLKELSQIAGISEKATKIVLDGLLECDDIMHSYDERLRDGTTNPFYCAIDEHHEMNAVKQMEVIM